MCDNIIILFIYFFLRLFEDSKQLELHWLQSCNSTSWYSNHGLKTNITPNIKMLQNGLAALWICSGKQKVIIIYLCSWPNTCISRWVTDMSCPVKPNINNCLLSRLAVAAVHLCTARYTHIDIIYIYTCVFILQWKGCADNHLSKLLFLKEDSP